LHPLGIILSSLVMALSYIGGENAQVEVGLPQSVTGVFQGLLLFFLLASDFVVRYRLRWARAAVG
jgi:simple sugar transport system permease protein